MSSILRKLIYSLLSLMLVIRLFTVETYAVTNNAYLFADVPSSHWAYNDVHQLRELKITNGIQDNRFGIGMKISRAEFITFLSRLMGWKLIAPQVGSFSDNMDSSSWYYQYIETALDNKIILKDSDNFRPLEPITREEMALMIVRCLGLEYFVEYLENEESSFADVYDNIGYVAILNDLGIVTGRGDGLFYPQSDSTREEAAAILMRMYRKLNNNINELHAFYSTDAYSQVDMIQSLDSVGFDWSTIDFDESSQKVILNTSKVPKGFTIPIERSYNSNTTPLLSLYASNKKLISVDGITEVGLIEYAISNDVNRLQLIDAIVSQINATSKDGDSVSFDGIIIDFEEMKGDLIKEQFNSFLWELNKALDEYEKLLYVAVHPVISGQAYYDGYDYKTIGDIADKVILMAHDYTATSLTDTEMEMGYTYTPLTPIRYIYDTLKAITDKEHGVQDTSKIWLQISFASVQWELKNEQVLNKKPYTPDYDKIYNRLIQDNVIIGYVDKYQNPKAEYFNEELGVNNVIWYEDSRSVMEKIRLAQMFGIKGISLWRLGNIPIYEENGDKSIYLDIWQEIINIR